MTEHLHFTSPNRSISMVVDHVYGGRISSLSIHGHELVVGKTEDPLNWGLYPMVPFAGRVRNGVVNFAGTTTQLPTTAGDHAIHGYGFTSSWDIVAEDEIRFEFASPWSWSGSVTQRFAVTDDAIILTMQIDAVDRQPVQMGWHPWFLRDIGNGHTAELDFTPAVMFERDPAGLPSGNQIAPTPGPWDDCFGELASNPTLRWGDLTLELSSTAAEWTVYDEPAHAICVEPQTGPPNQINDDPQILEPGESTIETFTLTVQ